MALFSKNKNTRQPASPNRQRAPVTAYYRGKSMKGETSPFAKRTPKRKWSRYLYGVMDIILVALILSALLYSLMIQPNPKVTATDYTFHSQSTYKAAAASQLSHLNNRNKITFDEAGLIKNLKTQFPEIKSVQVELPLFSEQPVLNISTDGASVFLNSQAKRYIVDASGKAVALAANLQSVKNLPVVDDLSGFRVSPGQQVLSADSINFIKAVIAQSRSNNIQIKSIELPPIAQEMDLRVVGQAYFVKFFLGGDAQTQIGQYLASRHHFAQDNQPPSQYLDVRVPGKVFYK